ncbi:MAG: right-handed parallel beta-helix repeat-containing protein, partial [Thermoplasmatota archaeon]
DAVCGSTVYVAAGDYAEQLYINKSLNLLGPNSGIPGTSTSRGEEATIHYPTGMEASSPGEWAPLIWIDTDDVTIDGFNITDEGYESSVNYSYFTGIYGDSGNNTAISNNIVEGFNYTSMLLSGGYPATLAITGTQVTDNYVTGNHGPYAAIYLQGVAGTVSGNTVDDVLGALQIQPYAAPVGGTVTNNVLSGYINGIYYNYAMKGAGTWAIEENTVTPAAPPASGGPRNWTGIHLRTFGTQGSTGAAPAVEFNNNTVDCSGANIADPYWDEVRGIQVKYTDGNALADFYGNTVTGADVGVFIDSDANVTNIAFTYNNFSGNAMGVNNTASQVLDASGNWYGTSTASGVAGAVSANVDYTPWMDNGTDQSADPGFQPDLSYLHVDDDSPQTGTTGYIQEGINMVSGSTVYVHAGTYAEGPQIHIDKDLTITGEGCDTTIITPTANTGTSGDARGWWLVDDGIEFHLDNVTLDGTGYNVFQAIRFKGWGSIDHVCFTDIKYPTYHGTAIAAIGTGVLNVTHCDFTEIGRIGINMWQDGFIQYNTYTGKGDGDWLDYFVDTETATVVISDNVITNCTGVASSDGSESAGILVCTYYAPGADVTIEGNTIHDCTMGVAVGYNDDDDSLVALSGNNIYDNEYGIDMRGHSYAAIDGTNTWANTYDFYHMAHREGTDDYWGNIQDAIDNATTGDTVTVYDGTYHENLVIDKEITLQAGSGPVIDGNGGVCITLAASNVTIQGFELMNGTQGILGWIDSPVNGDGWRNVRILDNHIHDMSNGAWGFGIYLGTESERYGSSHGMYDPSLTELMNFTGLEIRGNEINDTTGACITLQSMYAASGQLVVRDNEIHHGDMSAIWIDCCEELLIEDNSLHDCATGIFISAYADGYYEGTPNQPYDCRNIDILYNSILDNGRGISLYDGFPATISINCNTIMGNTEYGVFSYLTEEMDATYNWWGDATGPYDPSDDRATGGLYNPHGQGDRVTDYVDYMPYWAQPDGNPAWNYWSNTPHMYNRNQGNVGINTQTPETQLDV